MSLDSIEIAVADVDEFWYGKSRSSSHPLHLSIKARVTKADAVLRVFV
jgi:hypothetical protein